MNITTRVLILDDEPAIRRAFELRAARMVGVVVETVATPAEVRARLALGPPIDLVVCDFRLKALGRDVTSAELVEELQRDGVPVVVMTGDAGAARTEVDPRVNVLPKPIVLETLLEYWKRTRADDPGRNGAS